MQCVVLAGGLATRLQPLSLTLPKSLVPVLGAPFVDLQLRWLGAEGVDDVVMCIGHLGAQIRDHVGDGSGHGVKVRYVDEGEHLRGTGGALRLALDEGVLDEVFLVVYGDSYLQVSVRDVMCRQQATDADAVMTLCPATLCGSDPPNAAVRDGRVRYDKRAAGRPGLTHIDSGLSVLTRPALEARVPSGEVVDLADVLRGLGDDGRLIGFEVDRRYYEVGSVDGVRDLERHLAASGAPSDRSGTRDDWDGHWTLYGDSAEQNPAEEYRRRLVFATLGLGPHHTRVLDVGAGTGDLAAEVADRFPAADVLGLELSREGVERARKKSPRSAFLQRNLLEDDLVEPQWRSWASHAVCSEVLEHVDDPATLLRNAREYMAPGCVLALTVPAGPMSAFDRHIGHRRHFTARDLRAVLDAAGFDVMWVRAGGFPFFNLYRLAVRARGERLIDDVASGHGAAATTSASLAMGVFRVLFRLNASSTRWGWQLYARARNPG